MYTIMLSFLSQTKNSDLKIPHTICHSTRPGRLPGKLSGHECWIQVWRKLWARTLSAFSPCAPLGQKFSSENWISPWECQAKYLDQLSERRDFELGQIARVYPIRGRHLLGSHEGAQRSDQPSSKSSKVPSYLGFRFYRFGDIRYFHWSSRKYRDTPLL